LSALEKLQIPTHPLTGELATRTVESAYLYGLTLYDSAYVALAHTVNSTLYTADTELLDKVSKPYVKHITQL
jgi:predicted nucleic acid-binding protein